MILKKRQLVTASLVLALGAAVFVNWFYTKPHADISAVKSQTAATEAVENLGDAQYVLSDVTGKEDCFAEARLRRRKAQDEAKETLEAALRDSAASETSMAEAAKALTALTKRITLEADIETLVKAKSGLSCLVILDEDSAQVLLEKTPQESSVMVRISEIVTTKTGLPAQQITISETA